MSKKAIIYTVVGVIVVIAVILLIKKHNATKNQVVMENSVDSPFAVLFKQKNGNIYNPINKNVYACIDGVRHVKSDAAGIWTVLNTACLYGDMVL